MASKSRTHHAKKVHEFRQVKRERGCDKCNYNRCAAALDYHHRDPAEKLFSIGRDFGRRTMASIQTEILKCDLLCSNCHREVENCG